tara:strand:- start:189 stop:545 length:357 start_codon:yes stop_codon:yes gene_type:complete
MGLSINGYPQTPDKDTASLRSKLVSEEAKEVVVALKEGSLDKIAKELVDLLYVTIGTAISYGINLGPIWDIVHASNMEKDPALKNEDGKVLKPKGWNEPDIKFQIAQQLVTGKPRVGG